MRYPCNLIIDLLPLHHDGVCSQESTAAIEEHLAECENCRVYYLNLQQSDAYADGTSNHEEEMRKKASLKVVKKTIRRKWILASVLSVAVVILMAFGAYAYMGGKTVMVEYQDNVEVVVKDSDIVAHFSGIQYTHAGSKLVVTETTGQAETSLYFYVSTTLWNDLVASPNTYSEYVLAYGDKGASKIDNIYYFTGDYGRLEEFSEEELIENTQDAVLLWSR